MAIHFFVEEVKFTLEHKIKIKTWLKDLCSIHNSKLGEINIVFCSDDYLLNMNRSFLEHDYYTDIITFDNSSVNSKNIKTISGELFISIDRVKENASSHSFTFEKELHRVIAHGVLHIIGFKDKSEKDIKTMREMENNALLGLDAYLN